MELGKGECRLDEKIHGGGSGNALVAFGPMLTVRCESTRGFGRMEPRLQSAMELIRREACNGLTAAEVSARFEGSRRLVEKRFREAFGHSILDEIQNVRMEKVQFLLAKSDTPIAAIAAICGYKTNIALRRAQVCIASRGKVKKLLAGVQKWKVWGEQKWNR